jgi:hypothetical protein
MDKIEEIQKLKSLLNQEAITQDEYNLLKKNILEKNEGQQTSTSTPIKTIGKSENSQSELEDTTQPELKQLLKFLTQSNVNELIANTDEFWSSFHQSLALPYSNYNSFKGDSFEKWVKRVSRSPDLKSHLNILFEYVLLKGEFLIVFYQGFILTNYRLILNDINAGKPSIPLSNLINYNVDNGCKIVYEKNGQSITLTYNYFMYETIVNSAKARFIEYQLNKVQQELLSKSISELKISNPNLEIPIVDLSPSLSGIQNSGIQNTNNNKYVFQRNMPSFFRGKFIKYAIGIAIFCLFSYWVSHPSSSNSSGSSYPSSGDDRAVLYCNFCKKTVVAENGKDLIYYTNDADGCAVHAVNSGKYDAFCSPQCCQAWRSAMGQ